VGHVKDVSQGRVGEEETLVEAGGDFVLVFEDYGESGFDDGEFLGVEGFD
jgi:hypothetical protein